MRLRVVIPAITVALAVLTACASTGREAGRNRVVAKPGATGPFAAPHQSDRVLILANRAGSVSVRPATGTVVFRAPYGVAAPDSSTVVQAQPIANGTRVVASDPLTGVPRWSHDVSGTRRVRVVSPGGRFVALVDGDVVEAQAPRASTVLDIATAKGARELRLNGNFDPEAFSVDGRYLYALEFRPALLPSTYSIRRIDLRTNRVAPVPDRDGGKRNPMPGYSRTQLMSPDGRQLYTFYATSEPVHEDGETYHAFVHVLNLAKGWAYCIDLNEKIGASGNVNAGLAVSPDGSRLFVTDGVANAIAAIDTTTLRVLRTRFLMTIASTNLPALTATDGRTVFAQDGSEISTIDARTLAPKTSTVYRATGISALHVDASGEALYLLTAEGLLVVDRRGHVVHRWPAPGDATSMDPAVTVPGSASYRCAC
jgi:DNA-binding beta-propeller fold protein YncE